MKNLKQLLISFLFLGAALHVQAYNFEVDGIYYNFLEGKDKEVEVTHNEMRNDTYKDKVTIPETVDYNDTTYTVTAIGDKAFATNNILKEVVLSGSVTSIGFQAFVTCSELHSVTMT